MRLLVLLLGLVLVSAPQAQVVWKLSDALGNDRGPATVTKAGTGWFLRVEPREGGEERSLFHDGTVESLRILDLDAVGRVLRWQDLRGGVPVWEVTFDAATGLPVTETRFEGSQPATVSTWQFENRVLVRQTVRTPEGQLLFEDRLYHWPDGTLRRLERDGSDGPLAEAAWSFGTGGLLTGAWSVDEDARGRGEHREWLYAPGRSEETLATDAAVLVSRVTEALDQGQRETRTEPAAGRKEVRVTDDRGRTIEETVTVKDAVVQTTRWKYDPQGRLAETSTQALNLEVWTYDYQPDDVVVGTLTRDGVLVREETVRDGDKQSVSLYDRGDLFLVETWQAGKRVKETYYQKGLVVRERTP